MDAIYILIAIGFIHCALFFFNSIFVTCMHHPYLSALENFGLKVQLFRITWFTTICNRVLMKWGICHSKFWSLWFNLGMITTIILFPISIFIILKMSLDMLFESSHIGGNENDKVLEFVIPGVDIPFSEMGFYMTSLVLSSIVHELGHAMAAVREDVRFYGLGISIFIAIPVTYAEISREQLALLPVQNRLRVFCAGIWHNIILTVFTVILLGAMTLIFSPFFKSETGIFVKSMAKNSPLQGPTGLYAGDVVYKINDCKVKNIVNWRYCIAQISLNPTPGYCVSNKMVKEIDKSVQIPDNLSKQHNCCDQYYTDKGYLCFCSNGLSDLLNPTTAKYCLPTRVVIESTHGLCQSNDQCTMQNDICLKPTVDNFTKIIQIQRYEKKDVLFFGHPSEIYYTTFFSDWVPKYSFLSPYYPDSFTQLCKYIAVFSAGLAVINLTPCFFFDGQHIVKALIQYLSRHMMINQSQQSVIEFVIISFFTFLLGIILLHTFVNKITSIL